MTYSVSIGDWISICNKDWICHIIRWQISSTKFNLSAVQMCQRIVSEQNSHPGLDSATIPSFLVELEAEWKHAYHWRIVSEFRVRIRIYHCGISFDISISWSAYSMNLAQNTEIIRTPMGFDMEIGIRCRIWTPGRILWKFQIPWTSNNQIHCFAAKYNGKRSKD